ncbi:unnamed protein product, partial [Ectocarpus sp. 12 AP-2014]
PTYGTTTATFCPLNWSGWVGCGGACASHGSIQVIQYSLGPATGEVRLSSSSTSCSPATITVACPVCCLKPAEGSARSVPVSGTPFSSKYGMFPLAATRSGMDRLRIPMFSSSKAAVRDGNWKI